MRRNVIIVSLLTLVVVSLFGCGKSKGGSTHISTKDVSVEHGEDYGDNRESEWTLRNYEDKRLAVIKAKKGYTISNQMDFKCDILMGEGDDEKLAASISTCPDATVEDVKDAFKAKYKNCKIKDENGFTRVNVSDGTVTEKYCIIGNNKDSVVIELVYADDASGNDAVEKDIVSMVSI